MTMSVTFIKYDDYEVQKVSFKSIKRSNIRPLTSNPTPLSQKLNK